MGGAYHLLWLCEASSAACAVLYVWQYCHILVFVQLVLHQAAALSAQMVQCVTTSCGMHQCRQICFAGQDDRTVVAASQEGMHWSR